MAYSPIQQIDNSATASATTIASGNLPAPCTAGNFLAVVITCDKNVSNVNSVTDTLGNTFTLIGAKLQDTTNLQNYWLYYAKNILAGTNAVSVTFDAARAFRGVAVFEFSGIDATSPLDVFAHQFQAAPGTGTDAVTGGALTNTVQPALFFAFCAGESQAPNAGTGFTGRTRVWSASFSNTTLPEDRRLTSTGSTSATFTLPGATQTATLSAVFKEAATVATPSPTVGAISVQGLAPTIVGMGQTVTPGVCQLSLVGLTPVAQTGIMMPTVAGLSMSTLAPTIVIQAGPTAGAMDPAALSVQGLAPTLITQIVVQPALPTNPAIENDLRPTVLTEWTAKPAQAQLTLGTGSPFLIKDGSARISPDVGSVILGGTIPFVASNGNPILQPPKAGLDLIGLAPALIQNWVVTPEVTPPLQITGFAPSLIGQLSWHAPGLSGTIEWHST